MTELMIISGLVLIICITSTKVLYKFGVPMLLIFIVLGMLFGSDGLVGIYFDNYEITSKLCSLGLVFIMFYGGFGTNWNAAKEVAVPSILMSSLGVIMTATLTGLFCNLVIKTTLLEGFLIGSIIGSTDAASVFAILRSQKLNLKGSIASLLELESGSNDPIAYMMTFIVLTMMKISGRLSLGIVTSIITKQIILGLMVGYLIGEITIYILNHSNFEIDGFYTIFVTAIAILSYAVCEIIGGNGYLSVYITGILIGNSNIPRKRSMFHFFDGVSWIMQIGLFFMLGLLSFPSKLTHVTGTAILISIFMILIARPFSTFMILAPFKFTIKEKLFISWVGIRGAASVVFAIFAVTYGVAIKNDIFHIIFFMALFSVSIQGTLLPKFSRSLDLIDNDIDHSVLKTFTDYTGEINTDLLELMITEESEFIDIMIMDAGIPDDVLIVMIKRGDKILVPKGYTVIKKGDILVLSGNNIKELI